MALMPAINAFAQEAAPLEAIEEQHAAEDDGHGQEEDGHATTVPPGWLVAPFVILLLLIATGPLFYAHHWHHHYPRYALGLGLFVTLYYIFVLHDAVAMLHALTEYLSFIALVASLFIAASGIFLKVNARGTPLTNVALLSIGATQSRTAKTVSHCIFHFYCGQYWWCADADRRSATLSWLPAWRAVLLDTHPCLVRVVTDDARDPGHFLCH